MGAGGSVVDPSALRREYETKAAESVSDAELLLHMKRLIVFAPPGIHVGMSVGVTTMPSDANAMCNIALKGLVVPLIFGLKTKMKTKIRERGKGERRIRDMR